MDQKPHRQRMKILTYTRHDIVTIRIGPGTARYGQEKPRGGGGGGGEEGVGGEWGYWMADIPTERKRTGYLSNELNRVSE